MEHLLVPAGEAFASAAPPFCLERRQEVCLFPRLDREPISGQALELLGTSPLCAATAGSPGAPPLGHDDVVKPLGAAERLDVTDLQGAG